jgi:hypothetical protein
MLLAIAGSGGKNSWFRVKFQTQTSTKIPLESSDQGLSINVIKTQWFHCEIGNALLISKGTKYRSDSFWIHPD